MPSIPSFKKYDNVKFSSHGIHSTSLLPKISNEFPQEFRPLPFASLLQVFLNFVVVCWVVGFLAGWLAGLLVGLSANFDWQNWEEPQAFSHVTSSGMSSCPWMLACRLCNILIDLMVCYIAGFLFC